MDYRKFRQWCPPTIIGTVAYPSLEKSSLGQVADKAIPGQQEFAAPIHATETYKPPKSVVSIPMKTDNHLETAKHDLLSIHHEQMGNKEKAAEHANLASKLRSHPENPGNPTQMHYATAAKMIGLRRSVDLFIDLEKAAKKKITIVQKIGGKEYEIGTPEHKKAKEEAKKLKTVEPEKEVAKKPHEFTSGPAKTAYEKVTGKKLALEGKVQKRERPEEGVVGKIGKKKKIEPKLILGKEPIKPRTLGVEKQKVEKKPVAKEIKPAIEEKAKEKPIKVIDKTEGKTKVATKKLQEFLTAKPRSGASEPHPGEIAEAKEAKKPSVAGMGYSRTKLPKAEVKPRSGGVSDGGLEKEWGEKQAKKQKEVAGLKHESAETAAWKQRMGATGASGAKQVGATGAAIHKLKQKFGIGQSKQTPSVGEKIKQATSALSEKMHSFGQTPKTTTTVKPTVPKVSPSVSKPISTAKPSAHMPDAFAERHWDIQRALLMLNDMLKAFGQTSKMGRSTPSRGPGFRASPLGKKAARPLPTPRPGEAVATKMKKQPITSTSTAKTKLPTAEKTKTVIPKKETTSVSKPKTSEITAEEPSGAKSRSFFIPGPGGVGRSSAKNLPDYHADMSSRHLAQAKWHESQDHSGAAKAHMMAAQLHSKAATDPSHSNNAIAASGEAHEHTKMSGKNIFAAPKFGEGYAIGSIIGQETGSSPIGGTTPVTIGTQYGLQKLQQTSTPGAGGGQGYFPRMGAGGPRLAGTAAVGGGGSAFKRSLDIAPPVISGSRTFVGHK